MKQKEKNSRLLFIALLSIFFIFLLYSSPYAATCDLPGDFVGLMGDPTPDGKVDFNDLMVFATAYGSETGDPNWNALCDICGYLGDPTPDGKVNFDDLMIFATNYGKVCPVHNLTKGTYYNTIQAAIDDADSGDTVEVSPGTYYENINFSGKNITLRSTDPNDLSVVVSTIIDGGGNGSVVTFQSGETAQAVLSGFTFLNGNSGLDHGGGIYAENSSPTIENNIIRNNVTSNWGGGIYVENSSSVITGNTITANVSNFGGGIFVCNGSFPNISSNIITNNTAENHGGGIYVNYSSPTIVDNIINDNVATGRTGYGGGICVWMGSSPTIKGNTLNNNNADIIGGGIFVYSSSNLLPTTNRPTGWGTGRENIPTGVPLVPVEGVKYTIAGNEFLGNEHGDPLDYTEGAHVYFY